jgi:hypothetical protein
LSVFKEAIERTKRFLSRRKQAYTTVFNAESVDAQKVLKDLAQFCRAHQSTFLPDARAHAVLEGRREVWLRITNHLNMTPEKLWEIYGRKDLDE